MRCFIVVLAALPFTAPVTALATDEVSGTRGPVFEVGHDVEITLHQGHAELRVRRTVANEGLRHDQALFWIAAPPGAVATSLRTLGQLHGRATWFSGELMEAEAAAEKYRELTGIGGHTPKDPALLSWRDQDQLALQVFPVAPGRQKTVEYRLLLPTEYRDGRDVLALPGLGTHELGARTRVRRADGSPTVLIDGRPWDVNATFRDAPRMPRDDSEDDYGDASVRIAAPRRGGPVLGGRLAVQDAGSGRKLVRYVIEAAPTLAPRPRRAQVALVLDASRSLDDEDREAQFVAARAYLTHLPDAEVEVITFARTASRRYGRLVPAPRAARDLVKVGLHLGNGSNWDEALRTADDALARGRAGSPRRVLLLTDLRTRASLTPERVGRLLARSGALLHMASVGGGELDLNVDADNRWSPPVRATGGLVWRASAGQGTAGKSIKRVFEEWVRPVRVHNFRVTTPSGDLEGGEAEIEPETLDEGMSYAALGLARAPVPWVRAQGELWARPVSARLEPDPGEARLWSALVFGSPLLDALDEDEMAVLAHKGGAVSPVTSYLAVEPGVRPSTEGLEPQGTSLGGLGFGAGGSADCAGSDLGAAADQRAFLERALLAIRRSCGGGRAPLSVSLETTRAEVADVPDVRTTSAPLRACILEGVWAIELPSNFTDNHADWTTTLRE